MANEPELAVEPEFTRELSCRGWLVHRRTAPVAHAFRYRVWMLLVDVDRIASQPPAWGRWPVSVDRGHLLARSDVQTALAEAAFDVRPQRIFALTQPRSVGFSFNPVNFYFCYENDACAAILAHVHNTPWNERHCYALDARGQRGDYRFAPTKRLHVSPFMPMTGNYRWRFRLSARRIHIVMRFDPNGERAFVASLALDAEPLTKQAVRRAFLRAPAQNLATFGRIYGHAAALLVKGAPFHPHPRRGTSA